jgi:hypothetical protein
MKVLLVSLECLGPVVSGNGMYAAAIRRASMRCSALITGVMVLCGTPESEYTCHPGKIEEKSGPESDVVFIPVRPHSHV